MKILFFLSSLSQYNGGPSQSVPMLMRGLMALGVDVTLMTVGDADVSEALKQEFGPRLMLLKQGTTAEMEEVLRTGNFDLIQLQSIWEPVYHRLASLARRLHIPYIVTPRGMLEPWSLEQKKWKKRLALWLYQRRDLDSAQCLYATSQMEAQHLKDLGLKTPIAVIPNGLDVDQYPCRSSQSLMQRQVLFLSRIHEKKGIEVLLEAWSRLCTDFPDWKLLIVGNGQECYVRKIAELVSNPVLSSSVRLSGPIMGDEKVRLFHQSALFCLPSYSENFGMAIAEAMATGVAVITTRNCPWEWLNPTQTGWSVDLRTEQLETTLREAMQTYPTSLYQRGQRAAVELRNRFDYRIVAQSALQLYSYLLGQGERPDSLYQE